MDKLVKNAFSALKKEMDVQQTPFDLLKEVDVKNVPNIHLTTSFLVKAMLEKKRRGQSLHVKIQLPHRGGLQE